MTPLAQFHFPPPGAPVPASPSEHLTDYPRPLAVLELMPPGPIGYLQADLAHRFPATPAQPGHLGCRHWMVLRWATDLRQRGPDRPKYLRCPLVSLRGLARPPAKRPKPPRPYPRSGWPPQERRQRGRPALRQPAHHPDWEHPLVRWRPGQPRPLRRHRRVLPLSVRVLPNPQAHRRFDPVLLRAVRRREDCPKRFPGLPLRLHSPVPMSTVRPGCAGFFQSGPQHRISHPYRPSGFATGCALPAKGASYRPLMQSRRG